MVNAYAIPAGGIRHADRSIHEKEDHRVIAQTTGPRHECARGPEVGCWMVGPILFADRRSAIRIAQPGSRTSRFGRPFSRSPSCPRRRAASWRYGVSSQAFVCCASLVCPRCEISITPWGKSPGPSIRQERHGPSGTARGNSKACVIPVFGPVAAIQGAVGTRTRGTTTSPSAHAGSRWNGGHGPWSSSASPAAANV